MIPVTAKPEPNDFDAVVRRRGLQYLADQGFVLGSPLPPKTKIPPYWRDCYQDLYDSYDGVCAYLAIFFEKVTGAGATEHFVPKSSLAGQAYEWSNYRLATAKMNSRKGVFDDVLDPFVMGADWFRLELVTGHIYPNSAAPDPHAIQATIDRLKLDDGECRDMRNRRFQDYIRGDITEGFLRRNSPFIWIEADRQGLL